MDEGWARIGRLLLDVSTSTPLDEDAFADWLDDRLGELSADNLAELRRQLHPSLMHYLGEHLRQLPAVHLQLLAAEPPSEATFASTP